MFTLAELAGYLDVPFRGDGHRVLSGLASLGQAGPHDLSFYHSKKYLPQLSATRAGAVILAPGHANDCPADCLLSQHPYLSYAHSSRLFAPESMLNPGVHPSATVADGADVHPQSRIGPGAVLEEGVVIEQGVDVGAGVFLGQGSRVGAGTRLHPQAAVYRGVVIGTHCIVHSHAVLGADGFGFARDDHGWQKIHQLGTLTIGDHVEIGAGTTIDRGALDDTVIEDGVKIDNQVQIGHNCRIGRNTAIAGCVGLAGSTIIGADCTLAGGVGVVGHVSICDNVHVTGMTMVTRSITKPGSYSSGTPMAETPRWKRSAVRFGQLERLHGRLSRLERQGEAVTFASLRRDKVPDSHSQSDNDNNKGGNKES